MGLFSKPKMPNEDDKFWIDQKLKMIDTCNSWLTNGDNITGFFNSLESLKNSVKELLPYEKKYPNYFNPKPSQILNNFSAHKLLLEQKFIDRYVMSIERKLLDYTTIRGKTNNFNKMVDIFRYYSGDFEPANVNYFEFRLIERFPEFYK